MEMRRCWKRKSEFGKNGIALGIRKENIIQQFDVIHTRKKLVELTPWNFDYIVNGDYNVMVMFDSNECFKCKFLRLIYINAAKKGLDGVIFARINGDKYPGFIGDYNIDPDLATAWFQKGKDVTVGMGESDKDRNM
ncbi:uncharacterized protein [Blastocystis hominis]|uniref:Thioredoxin domain-containing protein n=1 Tax=Blastocystis hominis TaxID=12968 RepID=D8LX83_BLAHO|nr:uncharacterized protein [Blastocystis hominis]CBK20878.2 unnamed protein product [Blastocystis hominis]|eukprot:XP_012894926.1 uncharacterized protein [Blastocystis hominis]